MSETKSATIEEFVPPELQPPKFLRMRKDFIKFCENGLKTGTTRKKKKSLGLYELDEGSNTLTPKPTGVVVRIHQVIEWKEADLENPEFLSMILKVENAKSKEQFIQWLAETGTRHLDRTQSLYLHLFELVSA